jgi:flagellar basal-body rod modification protein FlgD
MLDAVISRTTNTATSTSSQEAKTSLASNYDTFLKLLTTQLQYQDPLDPMDSTAFTEQLVSFSNVEQNIKTNEHLENLLAANNSSNLAAATSYIGKSVTVDSAVAGLENGSASWSYSLASAADDLSLTVLDGKGRKVAELEGSDRGGSHKVVWDGKDGSGRDMPAGAYTLRVVAKTLAGENIESAINAHGKVTAIESLGNQTVAIVNGTPQKIEDIVRVGATTNPTSSLQ